MAAGSFASPAPTTGSQTSAADDASGSAAGNSATKAQKRSRMFRIESKRRAVAAQRRGRSARPRAHAKAMRREREDSGGP
jgi:hypothetical protein